MAVREAIPRRAEAEEGVSSFAKSLFLGEIHEQLVFPWPEADSDEQDRVRVLNARIREYCAEHYDPRQAEEERWIPDQVLRDADAAMYQAKARGRARYELFDPRFRTRALDRLETENALRRALSRSELRVHYQPVFDMATERIVGVEALLRWEHPDRSLLLPSEFLGVAEESGLIVPIGEWVLRTACAQSRRLTELFGPAGELEVAVNLSARQVANPRLVEQITEIVTTTGVDPALMTLEITESILMDDVVQSNETLVKLKVLGLGLAIDDFGTGYSSFAYLQRFPVDVLKVDRSFVSGLGAEPGDAAITEAIVTLCHTLGLVAVAEGVETEQQYRELVRIGCDRAQGFWKSRPLRADVLEDLIRSTLP